MHPTGNLPGPLDDLGRKDLRSLLDHFIQGPFSAVLHYDAVVGGLGGHTPRGRGRRGSGSEEGHVLQIRHTHTCKHTLQVSI